MNIFNIFFSKFSNKRHGNDIRDGESVFLPYEKITNASSLKVEDAADKILDKGWEAAKGIYVHVESKKFDWWADDKKLRSMSFSIHSWNMLDVLLAAYSDTKKKEYLLPCISVAYEWALVHRNSKSVSEFSWYDMAVGLRSYRLAFIIDAGVKAELLNDNKLNELWKCLDLHLKILSKDSNISFHNNHGYFQIAGQLLVGNRFKYRNKVYENAYIIGNERLVKIVDDQFTLEGVHKEHSPEYHYLIYQNLRKLMNTGAVLNPAIVNKIHAAETNLAWFVYPDGKLVNFGDSPTRNMYLSSEGVISRWCSPEMQYVASKGILGTPPQQESICFEKSGYWIVRKNTDSKQNFSSRDSYLALNAAYHSRTHKHADDLSFVWFEKGIPILVDSGRYGYLGKTAVGSDLRRKGFWYSDPNRIYCESTRAHNTLEFDDMDFDRMNRKPYGSAINIHGHNLGVFYCKSIVRHFKSIQVERLLIFKPREWLWVLDKFDDASKKNHNVSQWFNFSPELFISKNKKFLSVSNGDVNSSTLMLSISSLGLNGHDSEIFLGATNPRLIGWHSPVDGELIPSSALRLQKTSVQKGVFATLFSLSESCEIVENCSFFDSKENECILAWNNGRGSNEIKLDWDDVGSLEFSSFNT